MTRKAQRLPNIHQVYESFGTNLGVMISTPITKTI